MARRAPRAATGLTVSALAIAMLISGFTPSGGSLGDLSTGSDDSFVQEDSAPRAQNELTATRGIGKPEAHSDRSMGSDPWASVARTPDRSIARDSQGSYYLSDQLFLRAAEAAVPEDLLSELPGGKDLKIAGEDRDRREYRILLPQRHDKGELHAVAQSWEEHPSVERAKPIELAPISDYDLIREA